MAEPRIEFVTSSPVSPAKENPSSYAVLVLVNYTADGLALVVLYGLFQITLQNPLFLPQLELYLV